MLTTIKLLAPTNVNRRCEKALKAFFTIKKNVTRAIAWQAKRNLYRSYIVPILSYGSVLWKSSEQGLKKVEAIQMKARKWILSTGQLAYTDRLRRLDILPLSLYHELHVLLFFLDIFSGRYIDWQKFLQVTEQLDQNTITGDTRLFKTRNILRQTGERLLDERRIPCEPHWSKSWSKFRLYSSRKQKEEDKRVLHKFLHRSSRSWKCVHTEIVLSMCTLQKSY